MAYAAATCLKKTIERLHDLDYISVDPPSVEMIMPVHTEATSLIELLPELDMTSKSRSRKRINALDGEIREAVSKFQQLLESCIAHQFLLQSAHTKRQFSIHFLDLKQDIHSFTQRVRTLRRLYTRVLQGLLRKHVDADADEDEVHADADADTDEDEDDADVDDDADEDEDDDPDADEDDDPDADVDVDEDDDPDADAAADEDEDDADVDEDDDPDADEDEDEDDVVSSVTDSSGIKSDMVGLSDQFHKLKAWVVDGPGLEGSQGALTGMGGIGKTTLAKKIFEDEDVKSLFYHRLWVTVGRKCKKEEILRVLIAQLNPSSDHQIHEEDMSNEYLEKSLKGRRFLIVVDDIWEMEELEDLYCLIPDEENGNRLLVTTRYYNLVFFNPWVLDVRFLNKRESWELLREKVFGKDQSCPPLLVKTGKKIADKCDGLPLTILAIAKHLSNAEMTLKYWDEVVEDRNSVFADAYDELLEGLYPSYDYLPQHLKMCFLSAGVFPLNTLIPQSKLTNMWEAEEFLEISEDDYIEEVAHHSLFLIYEMSSTNLISFAPRVKTFRVHSLLWHLCKREARQIKFFHILSRLEDGLSEDIKGQRRLCIHNNVLFAIKQVFDSMEDEHCSSTTRSLGCYGPYHPYQVPITFGMRLLSLLDVLTIRFYEFPMEAMELVLLRYLALTYNGTLPASISKLWNLRFLIVRQHLRMIKSSSSYLPMEIWDMRELKHLQVTGSDLPDPTPLDALLPKLSTLKDVSVDTCKKGVLERIPNLNKLGLRIELRPDNDEPLTCLAHTCCLENLTTLKCVVVNPAGHRIEVAPLPSFSCNIRKLTLSGLCYPWEEMRGIGKMPMLEVLKLRNYAFQGPEWDMENNSFEKLMVLLIEDTDVVHWKVGHGTFYSDRLFLISLKHCYKLQEIQWETSQLPSKIQIVDCNPSVLPCWNKIILQMSADTSETFVDAHSTWTDGEFESRLVTHLPII